MKFGMTTSREIWNEEDKTHYQIGPDREGRQCVEIRYCGEEGRLIHRMLFPPEMARVVSLALTECAEELSTSNKR